MLPAPASSPTRPRRLRRISLPAMCLRSSPVKDAASAPGWAPERTSVASEQSENTLAPLAQPINCYMPCHACIRPEASARPSPRFVRSVLLVIEGFDHTLTLV